MQKLTVNASSRNGTLCTHPSLHLPKWESLENVFQKVWNIVEPPNKGHFGSRAFVLFSEVVLWWEVQANMQYIAPSRNIPR